MATKKTITAERVRELMHYNPDTGKFTRIVAVAAEHSGDEPGTPSGGYRKMMVDRQPCWAHRLAWLYMTGEWPPQGIDHRDGDKANNAWSNLRLASKFQNAGNSRRRRNNTSGFKGVSFLARTGRWKAGIAIGGKGIHLGYFCTKEEAATAYRKAAIEYFGEFARVA